MRFLAGSGFNIIEFGCDQWTMEKEGKVQYGLQGGKWKVGYVKEQAGLMRGMGGGYRDSIVKFKSLLCI